MITSREDKGKIGILEQGNQLWQLLQMKNPVVILAGYMCLRH
jgi:hypothetical protein